MMWNFIHFHLRQMRERQALAQVTRKRVTERKSKRNKKDDCKYADNAILFVFTISFSFFSFQSKSICFINNQNVVIQGQ